MNICEHLKTQNHNNRRKKKPRYYSAHTHKWIDRTFFSTPFTFDQLPISDTSKKNETTKVEWQYSIYSMNATCLLNDRNAKSVFFKNSENCFGNKRKAKDTTHKCSFAEASETNIFTVENGNKTQFYDYDYFVSV